MWKLQYSTSNYNYYHIKRGSKAKGKEKKENQMETQQVLQPSHTTCITFFFSYKTSFFHCFENSPYNNDGSISKSSLHKTTQGSHSTHKSRIAYPNPCTNMNF
jgi:hypothetical protein